MTYSFAANEATSWEVLEYLKRAYGVQINGTPFSIYNLNNWIRMKKLPEAYGGYKILAVTRYKELGNLMVLTLEGWNRMDVEDLVDSLTDFDTTRSQRRKKDVSPKAVRPRKHRTDFYYQLLEQAGKQYTKKTLKAATLPKYYKEAGIKANQLKRKSRDKKRDEVPPSELK